MYLYLGAAYKSYYAMCGHCSLYNELHPKVCQFILNKQMMAARNLSFEKKLEEKPTLDELCEHIHIGSKWYQLGVLLKLDDVKLDDIHRLAEDSTYKTLKMFKLWLNTNPDAARKHVLDALRKEVIEENTIAHDYEKFLNNSAGE